MKRNSTIASRRRRFRTLWERSRRFRRRCKITHDPKTKKKIHYISTVHNRIKPDRQRRCGHHCFKICFHASRIVLNVELWSEILSGGIQVSIIYRSSRFIDSWSGGRHRPWPIFSKLIFRLLFERSIPHKSSFSRDAFFADDVTVLFRFIELPVPSLLLFCRRLLWFPNHEHSNGACYFSCFSYSAFLCRFKWSFF